MTNYCFITGDSFEEDSLLWSPSAGQLISHAHQLVFDTFAKGGQGNFYILDSIIKNISLKNYKLAVVNWSSIYRHDYITNFSNWQVDRKNITFKNSHFSEQDHILYESLLHIVSAQNIFEKHGIPYVMWWGIHPGHTTNNQKCLELIDLIDSKKTFFNIHLEEINHLSSAYTHAKKINCIHESDNKHPNQEAHRRWSLIILDFMKKNNIKIK